MKYIIENTFRLIVLSFTFLMFFSCPVVLFAFDSEAIFAGGCFWCLEHDLEVLEGVSSVQSGYSGGDLKNPTYSNHKSHQEVVLVKFDPKEISYNKLLRNYWLNIDPFDEKGQFCDRGDSYRPIIFTKDDNQEVIARNSLELISKELEVTQDEIKVEIKEAGEFWLAEDYHQDFAERNNIKYNFYRYSCGRDNRLQEVWGLPKPNRNSREY